MLRDIRSSFAGRSYSDAEAIHSTFAGPKVIAGTLQVPYPSVEMWRKRLTDLSPSDFLLVATIDGDVVGNLGLHEAGKSPRRRHVGSIGMCVRDDSQGRGVGTALMKAGVDLADDWLNYQRLELNVYTDNLAALALYRKFGFVIEGYVPGLCISRWAIRGFVRDGSAASGVQASGAAMRRRADRVWPAVAMLSEDQFRRGYLQMRVGFVGWRGMVGSVLIQRMLEEHDFEQSTRCSSRPRAPAEGSIGRQARRAAADAHDVKALMRRTRSSPARAATGPTAMYAKLRDTGWDGYWIDAAQDAAHDGRRGDHPRPGQPPGDRRGAGAGRPQLHRRQLHVSA